MTDHTKSLEQLDEQIADLRNQLGALTGMRALFAAMGEQRKKGPGLSFANVPLKEVP